MASVEKEYEFRAKNANMDVNQKVKFRKLLTELKSNDRKASVLGFFHVLSELIFFWSILTAAMVASGDILEARIPAYAKGYLAMTESFFNAVNDYTAWFIPYAFISMMLLGTFRGNAERARTKTIIQIISLLTFSEQKSLLMQMQQYVDDKMDSIQSGGSGGGGASSYGSRGSKASYY